MSLEPEQKHLVKLDVLVSLNLRGNVSQNGAMVAIICAVEGEREENQDLKSFVIHIRELSDFQELWEEK